MILAQCSRGFRPRIRVQVARTTIGMRNEHRRLRGVRLTAQTGFQSSGPIAQHWASRSHLEKLLRPACDELPQHDRCRGPANSTAPYDALRDDVNVVSILGGDLDHEVASTRDAHTLDHLGNLRQFPR